MGIISNFLNKCTILNTYDKQYLQKQKELRRNHEAILDTLRSNKEVKLTILREGKTIELNMTRGQDDKFGFALTRHRDYSTVSQSNNVELQIGDRIINAVSIQRNIPIAQNETKENEDSLNKLETNFHEAVDQPQCGDHLKSGTAPSPPTILREGKTIELNMTRGQDNKFGLALTRIRKYLTVNQYKDAMLVQGDQILKAVAIEDVDTEFLSTKKFLEESKRHTQQFESEYFKHQKSLNEKIEVLEMMLRSAGELTQDSPPEGPK